MAGEILDNKGRGDAHWQWPSVHPEGRKFALIGATAFTVWNQSVVNEKVYTVSLAIFATSTELNQLVMMLSGLGPVADPASEAMRVAQTLPAQASEPGSHDAP